MFTAAGCSNSGRALPPAGPNQTQTIVTTTTPSTAAGTTTGDESGNGESTDATDPEGSASTLSPLDSAEATDGTSVGDGAVADTATGITGVAESQLPNAAGPLSLTAPWTNEGDIPAQYTCKGDGTSPALSWKNVMPSSIEVAIVMTDPDAADFVHWVVWGIPASVSSLPAGLPSSTYKQATNGFGAVGYGAPCPPAGTSHTYVVTLYELTSGLSLPAGSSANDVIAQLDQEDINSVTVSGQAAS